MSKNENLFSILKESLIAETPMIDGAADLSRWISFTQSYIDNAQLATYVKQEKNNIDKIESVPVRVGLYRELIEYIVSQSSQVQNPRFHDQLAYIPNGNFDIKNKSIKWKNFPQIHGPDEEISNFVASLFKKVDKHNNKVVERLKPSFLKISCQNTLVQQYIKQIESLISEENLAGLSPVDRKQVLIKLGYIQEITASYKEDIQNFFYLPITRSRLLKRLYNLKQLQQEIDQAKSNGKNNNAPGVVEKTGYSKESKFRKAMEFFSDMMYVVIDNVHMLGSPRLLKLVRSVGGTETCHWACKMLINQITGQQELVDEYLELVKGLASVENWETLTPVQKQNVRASLEYITNESVVYNGAVVAVKPFDPTVPLSKSILQTKITDLENVVEQLEKLTVNR